MKALVITPGHAHSARLLELAEPDPDDGEILCEMVAIGICGTDRELLHGSYGAAPDDSTFLVIGHESLGRVKDAPASTGLEPGDLLAAVVRRPDPIPCPCCAVDEWDMCRNGLYTERGIKKRHGFCSEHFRVETDFFQKVPRQLGELGVLMEPASVVAKAWEQSLRIASRASFQPERVLVTGAGPIGLLAAMMGRQKGYEVHVLDQIESGPKPGLVRALGATYHSRLEQVRAHCGSFDLAFECTGAPSLVVSLMGCMAPDGILCLTGVSSGGRRFSIDMGELNKEIVLENTVIFGSVNANRRHFAQACAALELADPAWLQRMITRRVRLEDWPQAFQPSSSDVKAVIVP